MAKFKYNADPNARHPHVRVVLMDDGAEEPWAEFVDGIFETDDKKLIERLSTMSANVQLVDEEAKPPTEPPTE